MKLEMNSYQHFYFVTRGKSSRINGRGIGILPMGYWLEANATSQLSGAYVWFFNFVVSIGFPRAENYLTWGPASPMPATAHCSRDR